MLGLQLTSEHDSPVLSTVS